MNWRVGAALRAGALGGAFVMGGAPAANAKPWKGAEMITTQTFRYGAFEARIRAAKGSGMITPFFLWKDGSERPGALWQEQDFEIFGRDGTFQTQLMTPGKNGEVRTEHVWNHWLPTPAWERYYTYRMEWTPDYMAFYVDGQLVRRETDRNEYGIFMDSAQTSAAQLRVSIWAGDFGWSGAFDPTAVPQAAFVNWIQVYSFTPGAGPNGSNFTSLWRDDFDTLSSSRWWPANWTFDVAVNDYVPQNAAARSGALVLVFTGESATGQFPAVPPDDGLSMPPGPPWGSGPYEIPGRVEAEAYSAAYDTTPGNSGDSRCGTGDVDLQVTADPAGGYCNVGWAIGGEWLEYDVEVRQSADYELTMRVAAEPAGQFLHLEVDGVDVSGPISVPAAGWNSFSDVVVPDVHIEEGPHVLRLVFETGWANVNYFDLTADDVPVPVCTDRSQAYQAENMSATTGGRTSTGWNIWSNGQISTSHSFAAGNARIRVNAFGQPAVGVYPRMIVRAGSQQIGAVTVDSTSYAPYEFTHSASAGAQTISVSFDNDFYANGQDRNLHVDSVLVTQCLP